MDEHESEKIFCSRPDYAERNSAHRQDDDRVGNGVQSTWVRAESFQFASMAKDKTGSVRQTKNEGHEHGAAYLGFERGRQLRLNQSAKEKFFANVMTNLIRRESGHALGRCWSIHCGPPIR